MSDETAATGAVKQRKRSTRSPHYPAFGLRLALERAREIHKHNDLHRINYRTAISGMGLKSTGSSGLRALAALLQFGILSEFGKGESREVQFTREAKLFLLDEREHSPERDAAIRTMARKPVVYKEMLARWGPSLPSDAEVKLWLVGEKGFNRDTVGHLIATFKDTVAFAKLDTDATGGEIEEEDEEQVEEGDDQDREAGGGPLKPDPLAAANVQKSRSGGTPGAGAGQGQTPRKERPPMPTTESQEAPWDIPIPLVHGTAILRVPQPLTEENLELLKDAVAYQIGYAQRVLRARSQGGSGAE